MMKAVAKRGPAVLFETSHEKGVMVDVDQGVSSPEMSIFSFFARGYWEDIDQSDPDIAKAEKILNR